MVLVKEWSSVSDASELLHYYLKVKLISLFRGMTWGSFSLVFIFKSITSITQFSFAAFPEVLQSAPPSLLLLELRAFESLLHLPLVSLHGRHAKELLKSSPSPITALPKCILVPHTVFFLPLFSVLLSPASALHFLILCKGNITDRLLSFFFLLLSHYYFHKPMLPNSCSVNTIPGSWAQQLIKCMQ